MVSDCYICINQILLGMISVCLEDGNYRLHALTSKHKESIFNNLNPTKFIQMFN